MLQKIYKKVSFFSKKADLRHFVEPNRLPTWNGIGKFGANNVY
jgi:hypothetical protein